MSIQVRAVTVAVVLLMPVSGNSIAQATYAELQPKGIKVLSGEEVKQLLSGAKMKGESSQGQAYELEFAPDGTMSGWVADARGNSGVTGKWSVNDKQQYCWDYTVSRVNLRSNFCRRLFKLGDDYYMPVSGQGKDAKMGKLAISK